ncbi:bifunctional isocitrate dehydrogenase kinase/phosphatase [Myxococcota bacterium]|nr:bifunctional isocitrate dehydrogenase kinase/phosphatase [Myxococcota bacterium]
MSPRPPTPSRLANLGARLVAGAFADFRQRDRVITLRARYAFERRDWAAHRADASARLELYRGVVDHTELRLRDVLGEHLADRLVWVSMKAVYSGLIDERHDWDVAETFFNSITRRIFDTVGVDPYIEFVDTDFDQPPTPADGAPWLRHGWTMGTRRLCEALLADRLASVVWEDRRRDAHLVAARIDERLRLLGPSVDPVAAEVLVPVFYRGKGAYLVGRLVLGGGSLPLVLALRNGPAGVFVDAVLLDVDDVSKLFSFTRSYFLVDTARPHDLVDFLQTLMPRKPRGELYISIGEPKQGKTELFRGLRRHLEQGGDRFVASAGTPGLVMVVFDLPGHDIVLKVIRDQFPPQKAVSPALVQARYAWVYAHDRAGRLVDAQPFEHLDLPADRFEPGLLAELLDQCGRTVRVEARADGDHVIVDLAYVQRKVTPLNLYLRQAPVERALAAVVEYGDAIRDLALCDIFPGDLLAKNFGVTRHGRVAFYDYDELVPLSSCNIRALPESSQGDDAEALGSGFSVGPDDVFPEEFPRFLGLSRPLRERLLAAHPDLFQPQWWREVQARLLAGKIIEIPPYDPARRLHEGRALG